MHWDFECTSPDCDFVEDRSFPSYAVMKETVLRCPHHGTKLSIRHSVPGVRIVPGTSKRIWREGSKRIEVTLPDNTTIDDFA